MTSIVSQFCDGSKRHDIIAESRRCAELGAKAPDSYRAFKIVIMEGKTMILKIAFRTGIALFLILCGAGAKEVHPWDQEEGLPLSSKQLIEKGALDLKGEVVALMGMGGLLGGGEDRSGTRMRFTTDSHREYDLKTFGDTKFVGLEESPTNVIWELGKRYRILGIPDGNTFNAIRVELISANTENK